VDLTCLYPAGVRPFAAGYALAVSPGLYGAPAPAPAGDAEHRRE